MKYRILQVAMLTLVRGSMIARLDPETKYSTFRRVGDATLLYQALAESTRNAMSKLENLLNGTEVATNQEVKAKDNDET